MPHEQLQLDWRSMLRSAGPYPLEAFQFVREGLRFAVDRIFDQQELMHAESRHISGQELCMGLRDYAIESYGLLAPVVLHSWKVNRTDDFGRIVFAMIDAGLMSRTDEDSIDDFRGVYDFSEVFSREAILSHLGLPDAVADSSTN